MSNYLNLYKLENKKTKAISDFLTYEQLKDIQIYDCDIKKNYNIYVLTMECCNNYIDLDK